MSVMASLFEIQDVKDLKKSKFLKALTVPLSSSLINSGIVLALALFKRKIYLK